MGGVPRSGTSLVQKMLDLHSAVYGGPELGILPGLMATYRQLTRSIDVGKLDMVLDRERARRAYQDLLWTMYEERLSRGTYRYLSEKSPLNVLAFEQLADAFPDARFVWVIRDPRDVLVSLRAVQERSRAQGGGVSVGRWIHDDLQLIRRCLSAGEDFLRSHRDRLFVVYYEDLLEDPRGRAQALCDFLGLDFEASMLDTTQSNDTSAAVGVGRKAPSVFYDVAGLDRPIDTTNTGKWRRELDSGSIRAVQAYLGDNRLSCLERYDIPRAGRGWSAYFAVAGPMSHIARAASRRLRRRSADAASSD